MEQTPNMNPELIESPGKDPTVGFDLRTHIFDAKTNRLVKVQPYLFKVDRDRGSVFERDGKFYNLDGTENTTWAPVAQASTAQAQGQEKPGIVQREALQKQTR